MDNLLLGVPDVPVMDALTLRGAVMEPRWERRGPLCGVAGAACGVPSLVVGRLPLDNAEAGLGGGPIDSPLLKKLGLRRPLPPAGEEGNCARLSMVRSDKDGRDFLTTGAGAGAGASSSRSSACCDSAS